MKHIFVLFQVRKDLEKVSIFGIGNEGRLISGILILDFIAFYKLPLLVADNGLIEAVR